MKTSKIILGAIIASSAFIFSCKKDNNTMTPETPSNSFNTNNKQQLLKNLAPTTQSFVINANSISTITGAKGTKIVISPSAFITQANQAVTGNITIKLKEALNKKDMILNNAVPVSNGNLLISGGEIYFSAWQNGEQLKKNPAIDGINISVPVSGTATNQMGLFYASGTEDLSDVTLNWTAADDSVTITQDSSDIYYNFFPDSINVGPVNWINCDYFWNDPNPKTTLTFSLTSQFNNSNTVLFLSLNGSNALMQAYSEPYNSLSQTFHAQNIPINNNFTLVAISYVDGNYYYHSMPVVSSTNLGVTVPVLTISSLSEINNNLTLLP